MYGLRIILNLLEDLIELRMKFALWELMNRVSWVGNTIEEMTVNVIGFSEVHLIICNSGARLVRGYGNAAHFLATAVSHCMRNVS